MISKTKNIFTECITSKRIKVSADDFDKHFSLGYAMTCTRSQGSTFNEPVSIYQWNHHYMSNNKYTAITRTTKCEFVNIMPSFEKVACIHTTQYIKKKISGYTTQDKAKKRDTNISVKYIQKLILDGGIKCYECETDLNVTNFTLDRVDNAHAHVEGNLRLACCPCNVAQGI